MKKALNIVGGLFTVIILGITLLTGWYQTVQLIDFLPESSSYVTGCQQLGASSSNLCTFWLDRFSLIAIGIFVPLILMPFMVLFLQTMQHRLPIKKRVVILGVTTAAIFVVHLSGILIYAIS